MQLFLQRIFDGLNNGAVYAVVAIALVLIFKATTLVNFAQANMAMFGTYLMWMFVTQQGWRHLVRHRGRHGDLRHRRGR